jgi:ubiquinone/menaquinone biosynthesis C-methylase UbiE
MKINMDWGAGRVSQQESFFTAENVLEIGGGDFSRTFALAASFPGKTFFSVDFDYSTAAQRNVRDFASVPNANVIKVNALRSVFRDDLFDFAFSIAVGEHITELDEFLTELPRVLRLGRKLSR